MPIKKICENVKRKVKEIEDDVSRRYKHSRFAAWSPQAILLKSISELPSTEYQEYSGRSEIEPVRVHRTLSVVLQRVLPSRPKGSLWHFQDCVYEVTILEDEDKIKLSILEEADKERERSEYLKRKFASGASREITFERVGIPEDVRIAVWRRDQGKCAKCEGRENLEYDHIIPVSKGGSNTVRNIELLCESCNRKKSAQVR